MQKLKNRLQIEDKTAVSNSNKRKCARRYFASDTFSSFSTADIGFVNTDNKAVNKLSPLEVETFLKFVEFLYICMYSVSWQLSCCWDSLDPRTKSSRSVVFRSLELCQSAVAKWSFTWWQIDPTVPVCRHLFFFKNQGVSKTRITHQKQSKRHVLPWLLVYS